MMRTDNVTPSLHPDGTLSGHASHRYPLVIIGGQPDDAPTLSNVLGLEPQTLECCVTATAHVLTDNLVTGPVVFAYRNAPEAIAADMRAGMDPMAALEVWRTASTALLALIRHNRRRALVVELGGAMHDPATLHATVAQRVPFDLPAPDPTSATNTEPDPVLALLAEVSFSRDPVAMRINAELEASLALPPPATAPLDVATVLAAWNDRHRDTNTHSDPDMLYLQQVQARQSTRTVRQQAAALAAITAERDMLRRSLAHHEARSNCAPEAPPATPDADTDGMARHLQWYKRALAQILTHPLG